jgi:hypothetical protein
MSVYGMPNLFSSNPVVMYLCVLASMFGLIRSEIGAFLESLVAISSITSNSSMGILQ